MKAQAQSVALTNYSILYLIVIHIWSPGSALSGYYFLKLYKMATCFVTLRGELDLKNICIDVY